MICLLLAAGCATQTRRSDFRAEGSQYVTRPLTGQERPTSSPPAGQQGRTAEPGGTSPLIRRQTPPPSQPPAEAPSSGSPGTQEKGS